MTSDLQVVERDGTIVVDSRDVAEMVGKRHDHLIRDIKGYINVLEDSPNLGSANFFIENIYVNSQNREMPCYLLTKKGCDMVANKMTGSKGVLFTATYVTRFEEMENKLKNDIQLHSYMISDPIKRAEKWIEEQKEKLLLEQQVEEQKPLVTFAEKCIKTNDSILVRELSKIIQEKGINIGEKKLYRLLREWGLILQGKTEPSQKGMNMELFEVIQRTIKTPYGDKLERTTRVTPKGQVYIIEKLESNT